MPNCELVVDRKRTKDGRSVCNLPGQFYSVSGGVATLPCVRACRRHAERLEKLGLDVRQLTPLESNWIQ